MSKGLGCSFPHGQAAADSHVCLQLLGACPAHNAVSWPMLSSEWVRICEEAQPWHVSLPSPTLLSSKPLPCSRKKGIIQSIFIFVHAAWMDHDFTSVRSVCGCLGKREVRNNLAVPSCSSHCAVPRVLSVGALTLSCRGSGESEPACSFSGVYRR